MKTTTWALAVLMGAAVMAAPGCKKQEDPAPTRKELIARTWTMTARTSSPALGYTKENGEPGFATDYFSTLAACKKDDIYNFASNGDYTREEGTSKCGTNAVVESGKWVLTSDNNTLSLPLNGEATEITLESVTAAEMKGHYNIVNGSDTYVQTVTFAAK